MNEENLKDYNVVIDKFEPMPEFKMNEQDSASLNTSAIVSIAISLKRIADALAVPEVQVSQYIKPENLFNQS